MDVQNTIHTLRENLGVRVHIMDLGGHHFDTGHPLSGMIIAVLAYAAQMELERIRERIQTVLDHKTSKGELIGTVPYGYDAVETGAVTSKGVKVRKLVPNETELHWLRQMRVCSG
jgi:DNA invertase Pin-like site-specific DNA recombinase